MRTPRDANTDRMSQCPTPAVVKRAIQSDLASGPQVPIYSRYAPIPPRLVNKRSICAYLGDISPATYDQWQRKGKVPGPVPGTSKYDVRAHDAALDRLADLGPDLKSAARSALDEWEAGHAR